MKRCLVWLVFLVFLLSISLINAASVDEVIEEKLEEQDEVSVIVKLKDEQSEQFSVLNEEEFSEKLIKRKEMVARQQDKVLANLNSAQERGASISNRRIKENPDFKLEHRYSVVNGFSGKVTTEGLERLRNDPNVEKIYFDEILSLALVESVPRINATSVWGLIYNNINITGKDETVCVIDTGIDYTHPNLGNCTNSTFLAGGCSKVLSGYDYVNNDNDPIDDQGHGTHVAGIVASDHATYSGVAPDANLVALKACDNGNPANCFTNAIVSSIDWCINNASLFNISVITMSIGTTNLFSSNCDDVGGDVVNEANLAANSGFFVAAAAGNDGSSTSISSPACGSNVIAVGAVDDNDGITFNRAPFMSILAPGVSITSTILRSGGVYNHASGFLALDGTSMATPHVAGAAALLFQYKRLEKGENLTFSQIRDALSNTGKDIDDSGTIYKRINIFSALLSLDVTSPEITFVAPTLSNNTKTSNTSIFINITSNEILSTSILEWNNGTKINQTMNGSGLNWYINKTGLLNLSYSYRVFGNDSAGNLGVSKLRLVTVDTTNTAPDVLDIIINSTDSLNRTNGTLTGSWTFSDNQISNQTKWFNNSVEDERLINLTSVYHENTTKNQNWTFSVRVYDGISWSEWVNATILIRNDIPELEHIANITINETALINITANAADIDIDGDVISYAVNDSRFNKTVNQFTWLTNTSDSGVYHVNVIANDSEDIGSQIVIVTILDAADFDNDGNPDFNDTDDDNDGIPDSIDYLTGNVSDITTTILLKLRINGSENLTQVFNSTLNINITDENNNSLMEFDWNFTDSILAINWTIDYAPANGTLIIRNLDVTKTVYINKSSSSYNYVCIADYDITAIGLMSSDCTVVNETKVPCTGSSGDYSCTDLGNSFRISGISHSGIKGIYVAPPSEPSPPSSSGGGGSTGGGGGTVMRDPTRASRFFASITKVYHPLFSINSPNISINRLSFSVNKQLFMVRINIHALDEKSTPVTISGKAYQYLNLSTENLNNSDLSEPVEIKFKVSKTWLSQKKVDKKDIALYRYNEKWNKLDTEIEKEDNSTVYYIAKTPGFSIFAIAAAEEIREIKEVKTEEKIEEEPLAITEIESGEVEEADGFFVIIGRVIGGAYRERPMVIWLLTIFMFLIVTVFFYTSFREIKSRRGNE